MHYYKFHVSDYKSHTEHLSEMEDLAYRRMLDWCYLHEKPLPDDAEEIGRLIRMRTHCDSIANVMREFWTVDKTGHLANKRVFEEIEMTSQKSSMARKSAEARWKNHTKKQPVTLDKKSDKAKNANALRTQSERNATQDPRPKTQDVKPIGQNGQENWPFDQFWAIYPRKEKKHRAEEKWNRLPEETRELIMKDVPVRYKNREKRFVPHPTTYLNQQIWKDEIEEDSYGSTSRQAADNRSASDRITQLLHESAKDETDLDTGAVQKVRGDIR